MKKKIKEELPVIVTGNKYGGCIESVDDGYHIIVKQGKKHAILAGDIGLVLDMNLNSGDVIKYGKIVTKESFDAPVPEDPLFCIKMNKDKICRKDGKVIYSHSYFTYNTKDNDEIIKED
jgi:hypothetical protein